MRKISQLGLMLALFFTLSNSAQASLLVEPLVGYNINGKAGDASRGSGTSYGGRLGYQNMGFQLGLDYLSSSLDYSRDSFSSDNLETSEWGFFVGYKFPILLRVYAAYIFSATGEAGAVEVSKGTGTKVGVGFTGLPFVNVNVEYRSGNWDQIKVNGVTQTGDADFSALLLSLSLPINL
jgi:hypothetical protein